MSNSPDSNKLDSNKSDKISKKIPATIYRRIFALIYDGLLTFAVMMLASMIPTIMTTNYIEHEKQSTYSCLLPSFLEMPSPTKHAPGNVRNALCMSSHFSLQLSTTLNTRNPFFVTYIFTIFFLYTAWFWTQGGQTLGMRAWKIRLETLNGDHVTWLQAFIRWLLSLVSFILFGAGFIWMLFDRKKRTFYDLLCKTQIINVEKGYVPDLKQELAEK